MSKQPLPPPPPTPTACSIGPCPTISQTVGRPGTRSLPRTINSYLNVVYLSKRSIISYFQSSYAYSHSNYTNNYLLTSIFPTSHRHNFHIYPPPSTQQPLALKFLVKTILLYCFLNSLTISIKHFTWSIFSGRVRVSLLDGVHPSHTLTIFFCFEEEAPLPF